MVFDCCGTPVGAVLGGVNKKLWFSMDRNDEDERTVTLGPGPVLLVLALLFAVVMAIKSRRGAKD